MSPIDAAVASNVRSETRCSERERNQRAEKGKGLKTENAGHSIKEKKLRIISASVDTVDGFSFTGRHAEKKRDPEETKFTDLCASGLLNGVRAVEMEKEGWETLTKKINWLFRKNTEKGS